MQVAVDAWRTPWDASGRGRVEDAVGCKWPWTQGGRRGSKWPWTHVG